MNYKLFIVLLLTIFLTVNVFSLNVSVLSEKHDIINNEIIFAVENGTLTDEFKTWDLNLINLTSDAYDVKYFVFDDTTVIEKNTPVTTRTDCLIENIGIKLVTDANSRQVNEIGCYEKPDLKNLLYLCQNDHTCYTETTSMNKTYSILNEWTQFGNITTTKTINKEILSLPTYKFQKNKISKIKVTYKTKIQTNKWGSSGSWSMNPTGWWDGTWHYRLNVRITEPADWNTYNYPKTFRIDINAALLGSNEATFWANTLSNGDDVRFTNLLGTVQYEMINKYWSDNNSAYFLVELPNTTAGDNNFFMYFGNDGATSDNNTSINQNYIFDDLEDGSLAKNPVWTTGAGTWVTNTAQAFHGLYSFGSNSGGVGANRVAPTFSYAGNDTNYIFYMRSSNMTVNVNDQFGIQSDSTWGTNQRIVITLQGNGFHCFRTGGGDIDMGAAPSSNTWYKLIVNYTNQATVSSCYVYDATGTTLIESSIGQTTTAFNVAYYGTYHDHADDTDYIDYIQQTSMPYAPNLKYSGLDSNIVNNNTITFNVYRKNTSTHLTNISTTWSTPAYNQTGQNSPFIQNVVPATYDVNITRTGYDSNNNNSINADANRTYTIYLTDSIAPTLGTTSLNGFTTSGSYITGDGNISATITDTGSGVDTNQCEYTTNGGTTWLNADGNATHCYKNNITITTGSNYTFNLRGKDNSGNQGTATPTSTYVSTLAPPTLTYTINIPNGFNTDFNIMYTLTCNSTVQTNLAYDINISDTNNVQHVIDANGTTINNSIILGNTAQSILTFSCTDAAGNQTTQDSNTIYALNIHLINEDTGVNFDLNKVTAAQAYTYDGTLIYDFKDTNTVSTNFISQQTTIRFDFTYPDVEATKISREINFDYLADANIGVCVAEYQQFYLYRFLSTSVKPVVVYNDFANCYNLASTTKFLYNTYQSNTAYTINKPYYLYTYSNGVKVLLALLDGANNTEINLDILAFNQQEYSYVVNTDVLTFKPTGDDTNTVSFYFYSPNDNDSVTLQIYNGSTLLWTYTELTDTNSFEVNFFYGDLGVTDTNLLKVVATVVFNGETISFYKYFNTKAETYSGILNPFVALVISFFIMFFGVTMVSYRFAMGWFGLAVSLLCIGILALAPPTDYIIFIQAIYLIIGIFIGIIGKEQNLGVSS